eukprot:SAG31_NODE_7677_length_1619_cov_1.789474_2_plen_493_part_01
MRSITAWKSFAKKCAVKRFNNERAICTALQRLARTSMIGWSEWCLHRSHKRTQLIRASQARRCYVLRALLSGWRSHCEFKCCRQQLCRLVQRKARTRLLSKFFCSWLEFLDVLDDLYALRRRALLHYHITTVHMGFQRWLRAVHLIASKRHQRIAAVKHHSHAACSTALKRWKVHSATVQLQKAANLSALRQRCSRLLAAAFQNFVQHRSNKRALRRTHRQRLVRLQALLAVGIAKRHFIKWNHFVAASRHARCLRRCADALARRKRLFVGMTAIKHCAYKAKLQRFKFGAAWQAYLRRCVRAAWLVWLLWADSRQSRKLQVHLATTSGLRSHMGRSWSRWLRFAEHQKREHKDEQDALAIYSERLLRNGCRAWLQSGIDFRTQRSTSILQSQIDRAEERLKVVEKCARRWLSIVLTRKLKVDPVPQISDHVSTLVPVPLNYGASSSVTATTSLALASSATNQRNFVGTKSHRPVPRRPTILFGHEQSKAYWI